MTILLQDTSYLVTGVTSYCFRRQLWTSVISSVIGVNLDDIALSHAHHKVRKNVTSKTCISEHEFMQVGREKFATGAKLSLDFAFGPHPHVLNVLCVNFTVVQIHKMCLMDDD